MADEKDKEVDQIREDTEKARKILSDVHKAETYWKEWLDKRTELKEEFMSYRAITEGVTKSHSYIPKTFTAIRLLKARIKDAVLSTRPYVDAQSRKEGQEDIERKLSHLISVKFDDDRFESKVDETVLGFLIYGGYPYQMCWYSEYDDVVKMEAHLAQNPVTGVIVSSDYPVLDEAGNYVFEQKPVYDSYRLELIEPYDFLLPDGCKSIETARWVGKKFRATLTEMREAKRPDGSPLYKNLDLVVERKSTPDSEREVFQQSENVPVGVTATPEPNKELNWIEYWTDQKIYTVPLAGDIVVREDKNYYPRLKSGSKKYFGIARIMKVPGFPFGLGTAEVMQKPQHTLNSIVDVGMDNFMLEGEFMWMANRDYIVNKTGLKTDAGRIIWVEGDVKIPDVLQKIPYSGIGKDVYALATYFDSTLQDVSAVADLLKGFGMATGSMTATGDTISYNAAVIVIKDMIRTFQDTFGHPVFEMAHKLLKQFMTAEEIIRITGDDGRLAEAMTVKPEELPDDCCFYFAWADREANKLLQQTLLTDFARVFGVIPPEGWNPLLRIVAKQWLINSGLRNIADIDKALDETIAQAQQMVQMQLASKGTPAVSQITPTAINPAELAQNFINAATQPQGGY